ncbi:MAG: ribosomal protein S18-alanine N-acetyltransferase, partial [Oscillospiraceae bacterium]|nr:ribosomal protein S18-alanine N-acetyltransferase [Oscillospiraceae bacterium]
MTQKIRIKKISESDIDLLKSCAELEKICIPDGWSYQSFLSEMKKQNSCILVAFDNFNQVAGFLTASYVLDTADLTNIAVAPEFRNQGIASGLLKFLLQELKNCDIFLEVRISNIPAINLYQKFHFKQVGIRKRFYQNPI